MFLLSFFIFFHSSLKNFYINWNHYRIKPVNSMCWWSGLKLLPFKINSCMLLSPYFKVIRGPLFRRIWFLICFLSMSAVTFLLLVTTYPLAYIYRSQNRLFNAIYTICHFRKVFSFRYNTNLQADRWGAHIPVDVYNYF